LQATGIPYAVHRYVVAAAGAVKMLGEAGAVAFTYFLIAQLGHFLLAQPSDVAVFWPASGFAVGYLIMSGRRGYPALVIGVVVGTAAANLLSDRSLFTSILKGFCNAGEAILVAWLLARWFGPAFGFGDLRRVLGFFAASGLAAAASAVGGAATMTMFHTTAPFWEVWRAWFLSDGVGIVMVAPFVVGLGELWRELPPRGQLIEGGAVDGLLVLTSTYIVTHPTNSWVSFSPGAVVLPMLLWLAARCHPTSTIAGAFFVSSAVICATIFGLGRFGDAAIPILERVKGAQVAVTMVTAYTLVLAALFTQRRQSEMSLKLALEGAKLGSFSADLATGHLECDLRAAGMHGHNVPPATIKESRRFVDRDDLIRIDAALAKASRGTRGVWNAEYRVMHPLNHPHAGETRWVAVECSIVCDSQGIPKRLLGVTRDITHQKRAEEHQRVLVAELDHRVKNVLAIVSAVAGQTLETSDSMSHFVAALDGRIQSMAAAHELLSTRQWSGISLGELVRREFAAYAGNNNAKIDGPEVMLSAEAGQAMGMVIHELVTNAAKYGALSDQSGRVSVRWYQNLNGSAQLILVWQETGGPRVEAPKKTGYGTGVIRDLIPYEFGGTVDLAFAPDGVRCRLEIPFDRVSSDIRNGAGSERLHHAESTSALVS
jgi:PAS domain S-box-containing protein